ncbi:MAG: sensor domain-containing phosphodiesterase [Marinobacter sp.]
MDVIQSYAAAIPAAEPERLRAMRSLNILDTQRDALLDSVTDFARQLFDVPTVLVSLVDADRQWFKSKCGLAASEHPREWSFCAHLVANDLSLMIVEDASKDPVLAQNPLVTGDENLRFYAGCAIRSVDGYILGSFCLIDTNPGSLSTDQIAQLEHLAGIVEAMIQNYGENRRTNENLIQQAFYDPITGLPTRTLLCERIRAYQALGDGSVTHLTVAIVNPRRIRAFNQSLGREQGDQLLREIAARVQSVTPKHGLLVRLHEDRFAILVPTHTAAGLCDLSDYLQEALALPFMHDDTARQLDFSIGIVEEPLEAITSPDNLIERAQLALDQAKPQPGTLIISFSPETQRQLVDDFSLENRLRTAIENRELELRYQPIVRMADQKIVGMEALARWYSDGQWISPGQFIPVAEESGLIQTVSEWILRTACEQFQAALGNDAECYLSVNIGACELYAADFVPRVELALAESGLPADRLCLEVTEHSLIHDMPLAVQQMQRLVDQGVHFAIDDFGTGFASLRYVQLLPVDTLKIDRCFVNGLPRDETDAAITRATIALADSLGLKVISEGIETAEQARFLIKEGIVNGQGWYYSKAEPIEWVRDQIVSRTRSAVHHFIRPDNPEFV